MATLTNIAHYGAASIQAQPGITVLSTMVNIYAQSGGGYISVYGTPDEARAVAAEIIAAAEAVEAAQKVAA